MNFNSILKKKTHIHTKLKIQIKNTVKCLAMKEGASFRKEAI